MGNILKKRLRKSSGGSTKTPTNHRRIVPNHLYSDELPESEQPNHKYLNNRIKTTKYTLLSFLPKNMFEQFHRFANLYFIFVVLLNWVPQVNAFGKEVAMIPVIFVLAVTCIKDGFEDYRRYKSDKKINNLQCRVYSKKERRYVSIDWQSVRVGDTVHLSCNEVIPADLILLRSSDEDGFCYLDTSNLDGENNLKQRHVIRQLLQQGPEFQPTMFTHTIECEPPNMEIHKFHGKLVTSLQETIPLSNQNLLLRGCIVRNTDFVEGIVVYAGHDSKALLNNRGPRYKRSKLERLINRDVVWCIFLLVGLCFLSALGTGLWLKQFNPMEYPPFVPHLPGKETNVAYIAFIRFWTFVILYQVLIPLSLYVSIELIKVGQVFFIERDIHLYHEPSDKKVECRALNITEELGQVEYVFSDKTGTLTENKMVFKYCSIHGVNYGPPEKDETILDDDPNMSMASLTTDTTYGLRDESRDPRLDAALADMQMAHLEEVTSESTQSMHVQDFFLLLTLCNTVCVSAEHVDQMGADGELPPQEIGTVSASVSASTTPVGTYTNSFTNSFGDAPPERYKRLSDTSSFSSLPESSSYLDRLRFHSLRRTANKAKRLENEDSDFESSASGGREASINDVSFSSANSAASSGFRKPRYEAESPDELALVHAAANYRCKLLKKTVQSAMVYLPGEGEVTIDIMHVLPFDARRKRMSIIFTHPTSGDVILYTKGADTAIFSCLKKLPTDDTYTASIRRKTQEHLDQYARQGFRTLCMAKKVLSLDAYKSWLRLHLDSEVALENRDSLLYDSACSIERDMELLGATGIEDRLQDGVPETITALRAANIKVWVLTGDKQETAMNIAHSCNLLSFDQDLIVLNEKNKDETRETIAVHLRRLKEQGHINPDDSLSAVASSSHQREATLVVDGRTLAYALRDCEMDFLSLTSHCVTVVCCRATPHQKAEVVKLVRNKLKKVTLAIGDGANDVNMIQTADIGVGISGQEGMQAVMSSDFALPRFRFLKRLLLVHGHWSYDRLARMALYMWYKNSGLIFVLIWYQLFNGFSGSSPLDDMNLILYNLFYTSLPPIVMGIFDQCTDDRTLMSHPALYKETQGYNVYKRHSYFVSILDAVYQSLVAYFIPHFVYQGSTAGIWEFGVTVCCCILYPNLLHFCIETKHWNIFHILSVLVSVFAYIITNVALGLICTACGPRNSVYGVFFVTLRSATHWFTVLLCIVVTLLPRYTIRALQGSLWPSLCTEAQLAKRNKKQGATPGEEPFATWSSSSNSTVTFSHGRRTARSTHL